MVLIMDSIVKKIVKAMSIILEGCENGKLVVG